MATSGSGTGTPIISSPGAVTLAMAVARVRGWLDDEHPSSPGWSDQEITDIIDDLQKELFADIGMGLGYDFLTPSLCSIAVVQGAGLLALDPRIVSITHAEFDGTVIAVVPERVMTQYMPGWRSEASGVPTTLVVEGTTGYLHPPLLALTGTLTMAVMREPLDRLVWDNHADLELEISRFFHLCKHGIMAEAYTKADAETENLVRAKYHRGLWEGPFGAKEKIRRQALLTRRNGEQAFAAEEVV